MHVSAMLGGGEQFPDCWKIALWEGIPWNWDWEAAPVENQPSVPALHGCKAPEQAPFNPTQSLELAWATRDLGLRTGHGCDFRRGASSAMPRCYGHDSNCL